MKKDLEYKLIVILLSFLPISILIGQAVSLLNIVIISIFIITKIIILKNYDFTKSQSFILLLILYLYLLFNTFISLDTDFSFLRNFGFVRFILLFLAVNYFFFYFKNQVFFLKVWSLVILIVIIDSYIEYSFGTNILGYGYGKDNYKERIVSFFKDEPIVAGYLNGFFFLILGSLFNVNLKKSQNNRMLIICIILSLLFLACIIMTGERSNTIKATIGLSIFYFINSKFSIKQRLITFLSFIIVIATVLSSSSYLKYRYIDRIINPIFDSDKPVMLSPQKENFLRDNIYIKHYNSGYAVFKNHPWFGVGNKNYRIETRNNQFIKENYIPDTHPHQIYLELLSEHGIIGTMIFLSVIFFLIFSNIKDCIISKNSLQLGAFCFLVINFLPVLPSGAFFSDLNITLFFINLSIYIACNPSSNIFRKKIIKN